ncbi:hypothetical protein C0995_009626 [Termitomyces sp. Mi166|nr:hypothetical protein C0995_009626 [Termitomyces sp. Mi166\
MENLRPGPTEIRIEKSVVSWKDRPQNNSNAVVGVTQDSLQSLYDTLSRKAHILFHGERVGPGWLKYEFNDSIWNLDDDSDYTIFVWRQHQPETATTSTPTPSATTDSNRSHPTPTHTPTLHLHNPAEPLPGPDDYHNTSYYLYRPNARRSSPAPSTHSKKSRRTKSSRRTSSLNGRHDEDGIPKHKKDFEKFHSENGVRTVMGSIGPVQNVRMLLRAGYRHVYISRKFAIKHGFIPKDAAPGHYGYGGLVNIGTWPITLKPSSSMSSHSDAPVQPHAAPPTPQPTLIGVFLAEEPHFDVVLGRSFFEKRQIRVSSTDPTDVVCLDTGEKIECRPLHVSTRKPPARWKRQISYETGETTMYINPYAIVAGLIGTLFIVTKMRHPHTKHIRESLEGSVLFKVINALDFYTGNHALFYDELFPEPPLKDPFQSSVLSICPYTRLPSPYAGYPHFPPDESPGDGAYQLLPALCATAGVFLFSVAIYLRKSLRLALRENQRNFVIHAIQVERRASQSQETNSVLSVSASNANLQQGVFVPSSSVSVVIRRDDSIFYPNADPVIVAPPMPVAISDPLLRMNSFESRPIQSLSDPAIPFASDSPPPPSHSVMPSATEAPAAQKADDDLPYSIPLPQDDPEQLVIAEESPGISTEPPSPVESDVTAILYLADLPFVQDGLDTQRSANPSPAPISPPDGGNRSPRFSLEPATRPISTIPTPQVSCRRPDWLSSAQYWEAHARLNALVSNTAADIETASDATARIELAPVISPADSDVTLDSPSPYKIQIPPVRATTSLAQPMTVSGSTSHWEHPVVIASSTAEAPFVASRTGADLVLAMSTSMPRVIDLGFRSATGGSQRDNGGGWVGAGGGDGGDGIPPLAEMMSVSPRASSILRQVAAEASPPGPGKRRSSAMMAAVLQTPWLNRTWAHRDDSGGTFPVTARATRSTGVSPIQTAVQTSAMRRAFGPQRGAGSAAGRSGERWMGPAGSVERPPSMRITRIFGEPGA